MPSTNKPTRSTRSTRTTSQASSIVDEDVQATPKKATRKRAAPKAIASSARSDPQTPIPSSIATEVGSATPRGLVSSPANRRRIKGGSIPEENSKQPGSSMEESMEESTVKAAAKIALGEMLSDVESGLPLTAAQKKAYETFEKAKSRQFKTSDFLDKQTLPDQYRSATSVSTSTFASLIKLANLTSFVHLVLSSAPDPQTKKRSAESAENLKKASLQLMKTVVPEKGQIDERILRLVVDLKCQAYLATSADFTVPALDFFKEPLSSHRPSHDPSLPLNLRPKLTAMSNEALNLIESSASDRPALETRWKWNEFATSCKRWAREREKDSPRGISEEPEGEEAETSEELSERSSSREINVDADVEGEEMITQESNQSQTNDVEDENNRDAERQGVPDLSSDSEMEEEASAGEQDEQEEEEANRSQAISRSPSKSSRSLKSQDQESDDSSGSDNLDLGSLAPVYGGAVPEVREPAPSMNDDAQVDDAATASLEDIGRSKPPAEVNERLRFDREFQLHKVTSARHKSSILDRQEDAVKIPFDSQPEADKSFDHRRSREIDNENDESEPRRKKGKKPSDNQNSPPASGSSRVGSTVSHEVQHQSEPLAPRSTKRSLAPPFDRNSEPLPEDTSYSEPEREYGGGFDDDDYQQAGGIELFRQPSPFNASLKTAGAAHPKSSGFGSGFGSNFAPPRLDPQASTSFSQPQASTSTDRSRPLPASSSKVPAKKNPRKAAEPASDHHFDSVSEDEHVQDREEENHQEEAEDEQLHERGEGYKNRKGKEKAVEAESSPRTSSPDSYRSSKRRREEEEAREARRRAKEKKKRRMDREETGRSDGERVRRIDGRRAEEEDAPMPMVAGQGNLYHQDRNQSGARIAWTEEETELLRELLDAYGPDWRKMMALHGPKGSKNAVFRERTNVSLKDKAVNLAKNFIKSGQPIPSYLHGIKVPKSKIQPPARKAPIVNLTDDEEDD